MADLTIAKKACYSFGQLRRIGDRSSLITTRRHHSDVRLFCCLHEMGFSVVAKLRSLAPRVKSVGERVSVFSRSERELGRNRRRDDDQPWRRWYKTARWQKLRMSVLIAHEFTCEMCGCVKGDTSQLVCDHIDPHGGDHEKFWNGPFQALCKECHDSRKQSIDRAGKKAAFFPDWLEPSRIPLTIVCGPPASGKSTYVARRFGLKDVVIDLDVIASELSGGEPLHRWDRERWLHPALFKRNDMLSKLSNKPQYDAAWFIVAEPKAQWRQWWCDKLSPQKIIVLEVDEVQCLANAARDRDRDQALTEASIGQWWSDYSPRPGDHIVRG